jgi:uncharacterized protein (UPF0335 family)
MRISFDNNHLFTVGEDGCLIIHDVKDRDPKGKERKREMLEDFSHEILTEKNEIEGINQEIEQLQNDLNGAGPDSGFDKIIKIRKLDEKQSKLEEDYAQMKVSYDQRYDQMVENKKEMEAAYEDKIATLKEKF